MKSSIACAASSLTCEEADMSLYQDRDHAAQGEHYLRHVEAMTSEGLHAKSAIAGELAARDIEIADRRADYERACALVADMHAAAMGGVVGPARGIVEDVADLRAERDALHKALAGALEAMELHGQQYPHMQKGYTLDAIDAALAALKGEPK